MNVPPHDQPTLVLEFVREYVSTRTYVRTRALGVKTRATSNNCTRTYVRASVYCASQKSWRSTPLCEPPSSLDVATPLSYANRVNHVVRRENGVVVRRTRPRPTNCSVEHQKVIVDWHVGLVGVAADGHCVDEVGQSVWGPLDSVPAGVQQKKMPAAAAAAAAVTVTTVAAAAADRKTGRWLEKQIRHGKQQVEAAMGNVTSSPNSLVESLEVVRNRNAAAAIDAVGPHRSSCVETVTVRRKLSEEGGGNNVTSQHLFPNGIRAHLAPAIAGATADPCSWESQVGLHPQGPSTSRFPKPLRLR